MKSPLLSLAALLLAATPALSQKYFTRTGHIDFFSHTTVEDIKADNDAASVVLDAATGQIEMSCTIKSFEFEKALMQEHFNENYMESSLYPTAVFRGKVENMSAVQLTKDGTYKATVTGKLTMHGVTQPVSTLVTFTVAQGNLSAETRFEVKLEDYKIQVPATVRHQIAEVIAIHVKAGLTELQKK